jgi:glycosyltransferase involved in cell wall biosynthesis
MRITTCNYEQEILNSVNKKKSILLFAPNPFSDTETGLQRVHKKIISENPNKNFHFFVNKLEFNTQCFPENCFPIKIENFSAENMLKSIIGMSYDIIEIPDFLIFDYKLKKKIKNNDIKYSKLYLSMHGSPSKTEKNSIKLIVKEKILKIISNKIYGISPSYTRSLIKRKTFIISPDKFKLTIKNPKYKVEDNKIEGILFIGRMEIRKGIIEFIEVAKKVEKLGLKAEIIGPISVNSDDRCVVESSLIFNQFKGGISYIRPEELRGKLEIGRYIVIVCSKWESFSLVSMDALSTSNTIVINKNNGFYKSLKHKDLNNIHVYKQKRNRTKEVENIVGVISDIIQYNHKNEKSERDNESKVIEYKYIFNQKEIKPSQLYE